jgi:hypothetical protein
MNQGGSSGSGTVAGSSSGGSSGSVGASGSGNAGSAGTGTGKVRAGASLNVLAPSGCALAAHYEDFPAVQGGHPVGATDKTTGVADGEPNEQGVATNVTCTLYGKAAPYTVGGGITIGGGAQQRILGFQSKLEPADSTGSVVLTLPGGVNYHGTCSFSAIHVDVDYKNVWGSMTCETLTGEANDVCAMGPSYFFFENCSAP